MRVANTCDAAIMAQLQAMLLQCNPFVRAFKQVNERVTTENVNMCFMANTGKNVAVVQSICLYIDVLLLYISDC